MNPTLGLLLPLMIGQPVGPGCAPCNTGRPPMMASIPCSPGRMPYLATIPQPPYFKAICPPSGPPAPVLAMKAVLEEGMTIIPKPADPKAEVYPSGTVFGFRPGYRYHLKLDNIPGHPGESLYPVLEVRGSIVPRPGMKYMEYPATFTVTKFDLEKAFSGRLITKVIYLEDPHRAVPMEATPDRPIEVGSESFERALQEAEDNGRLVAILRMGDRTATPDELARLAVPNTVLVPGTTLGPAAAPPMFGCSAVPLYDPILGPKTSDLECFTNGGDTDGNLGIGRDGTVQPIRNTNTVAEYLSGSRKKFNVSNEVCICAPRFIIRRADVGITGIQGAQMPGSLTQITGRDVFQQRAQSQAVLALNRLLAMESRLRASQSVSLTGLHAFGSKSGPQAVARMEGVSSLFVVSEVDEISNFPGQLVLTKTVSPSGAVKQGDILTVTLKYHNNTRQPVTDLLLSDSLTARLEYIPGSAAADRPSNVTLADNEVGSQVVRFEIPGPIPPAGNGVVVFKVKVR